MLYLLLAIISSTGVSLIMRLSGSYIKNNMTMFIANYCICTILALCIKGDFHFLFGKSGSTFAISLAIISGILYLISFIFLQVNVKRNGVVLSGTFMKLGVIVPIIMAVVIFREQPKLLQSVGCFVAIIAILLIQLESDSKEISTGEKKYRFLLVLLLVVSGFTDSLSNIFDKFANPDFKEDYLIITFFIAAVTSVIIKIYKKQGICKWDILFGMLIGIPNYFSARFLLLALGKVPAIIVYPVYSVATIVCITFAGMIFFKEKLTTRKWIALGMILVALICINV